MKLSANSVKADGSNPAGPPQLTYSQTAGFPTIAPAPTFAQSHGGMISTHQGQQFQVISSPSFATAPPNPSNQYGIPQFATYNQQGQLVLSSPNFPGAATPYGGGQQIILTAAGQQAPPAPQQPQQANKATLKPAATSNAFVPMSQQPTGYTIGTGPTFMFATAPNTTLAEAPQTNAPNNAAVVPKNEPPKAGTAPQAVQAAAPPQATAQPTANSSNIIMHNGIAYMNPQHILSSSNGQIILRTHDHQPPQQIMLPPQPTPAPLRQAVAAAPPPKAPSRSLPPILPTTTTMVTRPLTTQNIAAVSTTPYTLPQTPVSQAALTSSPKSSNSSGGKNSGAHAKNSILKSVQNHQRSTPPGVIMAAAPGGPPILSQQQPHTPQQAVQLSQQPPTLQPMHTYTPPPPSSSSMAPTTMSNTTATSTKVLSSSSNSGKKNPVIKAAPPKSSAPASTPPPTDNSTPKAFVKPNVLTHVIDGHIIQESSSPFPLESSAANSAPTEEDEKPGRVRGSKKEDECAPPSSALLGSNNHAPQHQQHQQITTLSAASTNTTTTTKSSSATTNNSSVTPHAEKKRGPGRPPGSTRQNIDSQRIPGSEGNTHKGGNHHHIKDGPPNEKRRKLEDPIIKPAPPTNPLFGKNGGNPLKWSVQQVCDFVKSLHGCAEYVEDFMLQEIDGQALMLLKTEHLMAAMSIKLGPALKICSAINEMREEVKQQV